MIFDCFSFFREFELLKLRCEELKPLGVTHILVESDHTHQGQPKLLYFEQQKHLFADYNIQHTVYRADPSLGPWANERAQRDFAWDDSIKDGDILILTDADEIPRADTVRKWIVGLVDRGFDATTLCAGLEMRGHKYFVNRKPDAEPWTLARIMSGTYAKGKSLSAIRNAGVAELIPEAGWHFSWMGGFDRLKEKFQSFAHAELNTPHLHANAQGYWEGELAKEPFLRLDATYPQYLLEQQTEFAHMIHSPTPVSAVVLYPVPCESTKVWKQFRHYVERFCSTWRQYPPGATVELIALCCKAYPSDELLRLFEGLPARFLRYDGDGADLGAHQWAAKELQGNPLLICCTSRMYFHREGWADRLLQARESNGVGLYGISASYEGGKLHLCTRGYCLDAEDFRAYPVTLESRDKGVYFECGEGCLLDWMAKCGREAFLVYWDGIWAKKDWFERPNIFRRGDQSNMLMWDKHTDLYSRADAAEKTRLEAMAFCHTKKLTTVSRSGVGDRIRLLLNGYRLAQKLGRKHVHLWEPSEHCGANFDDLFWSPTLKVARSQVLSGAISVDDERKPWAETEAELQGASLDPHILLHSFCEDCGVEGFGSDLLTFSAQVWEKAIDFRRGKPFTDETVGVHVRGRDYGDRMATVEDYLIAVEKAWQSRLPPSVFLATDEIGMRKVFREHYGDRLIEFPVTSYERGSREAVIESMIELCLLRMCRRQVLSAYSGFSMLAIKEGDSKRGVGIRIVETKT